MEWDGRRCGGQVGVSGAEGVAEGGDALDRRAALEAGADAGWRVLGHGVGCCELWAGWLGEAGWVRRVGVSFGCFGQEASI